MPSLLVLVGSFCDSLFIKVLIANHYYLMVQFCSPLQIALIKIIFPIIGVLVRTSI